MNRPRSAIVVLMAVLALTVTGITGCGPRLSQPSLAAPTTKPPMITFSAPPSFDGAIVDRDSSHARAQLKAMLLTARPAEHVVLWDADTGRRLGSFTTPPGLMMRGPTPPAALPPDPTQVQCDNYRTDIAQYQAILRADLQRLHQRWMARLLSWVNRVAGETTTAERAHTQTPEIRGFQHALSVAAADITSLKHLPGANFGRRMVLAILELDGVPTQAPPHLSDGLQGITIVVTGFMGTSSQEITWQSTFTHDGAREAVVLTPSTSQELPLTVEPVLSGDSQPSTLHQAKGC
jgi:hypothetical protein